MVSSIEKMYIVQLLHMKKKKKKINLQSITHTITALQMLREKTQKHKRSHRTYLHYFVHSELIRS